MAGWAEAAQQGSSSPPHPTPDKLDSALCLQLHAHVFWGSCHPGSCSSPWHLSRRLQGFWRPSFCLSWEDFIYCLNTLFGCSVPPSCGMQEKTPGLQWSTGSRNKGPLPGRDKGSLGSAGCTEERVALGPL